MSGIKYRNLSTLLLCMLFVPLSLAQESGTTVNLSTTVSGNQEQPKVLYIVPWKAPEVAAATRQGLQSQLLSVFSHVERQALQRQLQHLEKVKLASGDEQSEE